MKRIIILALSLLLSNALFVPAGAIERLIAAQAKQHIGETATVRGLMASARYAGKTNGSPAFLDFEKRYPESGLFKTKEIALTT